MKKIVFPALAAIMAIGAFNPAQAADLEPVVAPEAEAAKKSFLPGEFSVSAGVYSDYRFRGISQTDKDVSFQGTLGWSIETPVKGVNLDLGLFGSNINFSPNQPDTDPDDGSVELDYLAGFSGAYKNIDWSVGAAYYNYPDADNSLDQDYIEVLLGVSSEVYKDLTLGLNYAISPDYFGNSGVSHFIQGTAAYEIGFIDILPLTIDGSIGYQVFEGDGDYLTWHVGLTAQVHEHASVGVQYVDTDIASGDLTNLDGADIADAGVVGFFTVNF